MTERLVSTIIFLLCLCCAAPAFTAAPAKTRTKIVVGGDYDNPPYEFIENGRPTGFNIDLINAVAESVGLSVEIRLGPWGKVRHELESGQINALAGMYYSSERNRSVDFSVPHTLVTPGVFVRSSSTIRSFEDLKEKEIIVQQGDIEHDYLTYHPISRHIIAVKNPLDELLLLSSGKHDCALMPSRLQGEYLIAKNKLSGIKVFNSGQPQLLYCFAVRKGDRELAQRLDEGLNILRINGRYREIYQKWFGMIEKRETTRLLLYFVPALALFMTLLVVSFVWSRTLQRSVRAKTEELWAELDQRKRIETELKKSEERLTRFFEAAFEGIFFHELGTITDANLAGTSILGYLPGEVTGRPLMDFIAPESRMLVMEKMGREDTGEYEIMAVRQDGALIPLEIRARSLDSCGTTARVVGFRDISERKRAEAALHRYRDELEAKTESLEAICSIAEKLYCTLDLQTVAEQAVAAMLHRSSSPSVAFYLFDRDVDEFRLLCAQGFSDALLDVSRRLPLRASLSGMAFDTGSVFVCKDMSADSTVAPEVRKALMDHGYRSAVSVPLLADKQVLGVLNLLYRDNRDLSPVMRQELLVIGQTVGLAVSHAINLTRLREEMEVRLKTDEALRSLNADLERRVVERTAELAEAKERAEAADHLKSAFLATMSHELRTPLNSIIGFTGVILQGMAGPLNNEQQKQMHMVKNSANHLLALINDVLDLSKIEAGQLTLQNQDIEPATTLEKVVRSIHPLVDAKGLTLILEVAPDVPLITNDQRRLEQVLLNLLSNAVKFTEQGVITVRCRNAGGRLYFSVSDTGIGIRQEDLANLFQPFRQLESGLTRRFEGTGLGLSICKKLIERMGGEIGVEDSSGGGSTFYFTLPTTGQTT